MIFDHPIISPRRNSLVPRTVYIYIYQRTEFNSHVTVRNKTLLERHKRSALHPGGAENEKGGRSSRSESRAFERKESNEKIEEVATSWRSNFLPKSVSPDVHKLPDASYSLSMIFHSSPCPATLLSSLIDRYVIRFDLSSFPLPPSPLTFREMSIL